MSGVQGNCRRRHGSKRRWLGERHFVSLYVRSTHTSSLRQHHLFHPHYVVTSMFAALCLASPDTSGIDLSYIDTLPSPDAPTLYCTFLCLIVYASARVLMGELLEQQGRHADAISWAQAELQDQSNLNVPSKTRAGRLLGRCHAAVGEHMLSVAALDAALRLAKTGNLMYSEALTVREHALAGKGVASAAARGSGSDLHWSKETGKQRLVEMMGRMHQEGGNRALLEVLLL